MKPYDTGFFEVPDAPERAAGQDLPPWGETKVVGKRTPRVDGYERATGSAVYTLDMTLPNMLYAAIARCPHASAKVKRVDTTKAQELPGVAAVITGSSPGAAIGWYHANGKPTSMLFDTVCRHEGEEVAAVAAETQEKAEAAARAVVVEYEPGPFVLDLAGAVKPEAVAVHGKSNKMVDGFKYERGNVDAGFKEADFVLEETYSTATQLHTTMEVHASLAKWDGDRLTVWDSTQGVFEIQRGLAAALKLPQSSVRVICPYMGGGFGSKIEPNKHTVIAALLAKQTGRPVKIALPREDTFRCVGNRPAHAMTIKAGVKKDGTITALQFTSTGEIGAYPEWSSASYPTQNLYKCANVRTEETMVYVNAGKARAFRAPSFPQGAWALEQMVDAMAEKIGMCPVEFRIKNVAGKLQSENIEYTSNGLKQCLEEGAKAFGWHQAKQRERSKGPVVRGVGVAGGMWGYQGEDAATVVVKLFPDGSVNLNMGASDLGTGTKTVMAMVVAEELAVPLGKIQIEHADTGTTQYAPVSGGSQTVLSSSPAVRSACAEIRKRLIEMAAAELRAPAADIILKEGRAGTANAWDKAIPIAALKELNQHGVVVGVGRRHPHPAGKTALPFAAQFAEVEVNTRTGEIKVLRMVAAHDSGRAMNPLTYENQVFGGMTMGLGFGMMEHRVLDRQTGKMANANWHDYKIPTAMDVPVEQACIVVDPHDKECNTAGAKGLGEPATIPTAAAIANAVYNATGIRVTDAPITTARMLRLLSQRRERS